jgi:putative ABC transport system permease protein
VTATGWRRSLALSFTIARRELRGGLTGFRLFMACLALGVGAIAAVQSLSLSVLAGMQRDGRAILGGDASIQLIYNEAPPAMREFFEQSGRTSLVAELRSMARRLDVNDETAQSEEKAGHLGAVLAEVKGVDSAYPLAGKMTLAGGADFASAIARQSDGLWGAVVEPGLLERLGLAVGDEISLGDIHLRLTAAIDHEPDRLSGQGFSIGPRVLLSLDALKETGLIQPGSLVYWRYRIDLGAGADPAAWQARAEATFPDAGWRIRLSNDAAPRVARFIDRLGQFLTLVGLTSLLVGGIGASNAVTAYLDGRLATIATLKGIGASARIIFGAYLIQILVLTAGAIVLGLVAGALLPMLAILGLNKLLPVEGVIGLYPGALGLAALFGLLTSLTFSLVPLARAQATQAAALFRGALGARQRLPARAWIATAISGALLAALAIASADNKLFALGFVGGAALSLALFRFAALGAVALAARLPRPRQASLRLALANLHRPGNPTATIVQSLGIGLTVLVAIALIQGNFSQQVAEGLPEDAPSFFFLDVQSSDAARFSDALKALPGVESVEETPMLRGNLIAINGVPADQAHLPGAPDWLLEGDRGVTYAAAPPAKTDVVAGSWWPADYQGEQLVSVSQDFVEQFGIKVGDEMTVRVLGREIKARIASIREIDWSTMAMNFAMVFSPGILAKAPHTVLASARTSEAAELPVMNAVGRDFPNVSSIRLREALAEVNRLIGNIGIAVRVTAAVTLISGTLVLAGAIAAGHRRRVYDAVVLKVLGATRRDLMKAFLAEFGLIGLLTAAIAAIIGTAAAWAVMRWIMPLPWQFLPVPVIATALIAAAITLVAGFAGTWIALGQKAAPLLRNE